MGRDMLWFYVTMGSGFAGIGILNRTQLHPAWTLPLIVIQAAGTLMYIRQLWKD